MARIERSAVLAVSALVALLAVPVRSAQREPGAALSVDRFLSPAYPYELVSARSADRIAWLAYERGRRNVYTAAAPDFEPVALTRHTDDDGVDLTSLSISSDGSIVAFVRGHAPNRQGWVANPTSRPRGAERAIWVASTTGGTPRRLGPGGNPVLAPDGSAVLFVKDGQIHRYLTDPTAGPQTAEAEEPLVRAWGRNSDPVWSPDSTRFAFVSDRGDHSFIVVYDTRTDSLTYLEPGVDHDTSPVWSPDGRQIAFIRRPGTPFGLQDHEGSPGIGNPPGPAFGQRRGRRQGGRTAIEQEVEEGVPGLMRARFSGGYTLSFWVADAATGQGREIWHNKPDDRSFDRVRQIHWAGDRLVFEAEPGEWVRYFSVAAAGGTDDPVVLTPGEGMVENVNFSPDGKFLYYTTNAGDIDRRHVWKVSTAGGDPVQLTKDAIETYPAVLASGKHVATLTADAARPLSVGVVGTAGGSVNVLFPVLSPEFPADAHVVPTNVTLTADDGLEFHNQLFLPRDIAPGERRPAVVFVHGGPIRQMLLGYHYRHFYHMAYGVNQWLASKGYIVLSVNYRRGIGYGKSFRMAPNTGGDGNAEYKDVLAAGKYLRSRPDVDPDRIGIWGLSYGGVLTAQALARNSDIFKAGVDLAGVHLWGSSIDPDSGSFQSSAIGAIETWKSPVLLVHGDDDRNVQFSQTTGLVQLLRAHDVHYELIVFPDDVHDSLLYSRWIYTFERMDAFLDKFLRGDGKTTSQGG